MNPEYFALNFPPRRGYARRLPVIASLLAGLALCTPTHAGVQQLETINLFGFGAVPTETDYVPNVVFSENGGASFEALKAQAVAARTFAYYKIKTSGIIQNGTSDQVYHVPGGGFASQIHFDATDATEGEILTIRDFADLDILIASFYVAGAIPSGPTAVPNPGDPDPTSTEQWVTYTYNDGLIGGFNIGTPLGFQGTPTNPNWPNRGAKSQNGANFLGNQGVSYVDILKFYYGADIQLETVTPVAGQPPLLQLKTLTDFELNNGYLGNDVNFSSFNQNMGAGTASLRTTTQAHDGIRSQRIDLDLDELAGTDFLFHHVAGTELAGPGGLFTGEREANLALQPVGSIGFWLKTDSPGLTAGVKLDDDRDGTEQSTLIDVINDGLWHKYEWSLQNASLWSSALFGGGDGSLGDSFTLDSIVFTGNSDSVVFLDDVFYNPPDAGPILGDIDGDGFVGVADLNIMLLLWNQSVPKGDHSQGDLAGIGDGFVGVDDLNVLLNNWNQGALPPADVLALVPEPGASFAFFVFSAAILRRRRL